MGRPSPTRSGSSSGEEDGDAEWKSAIQSIAAATTSTFAANGFNKSFSNSFTASTTKTRCNLVSHSTPDTDDDDEEEKQKQQPQKLKHYQIKAHKLLEDMLEKTLVIVKDVSNVPDDDSMVNEGGVRLFKNSTPGIVFDHVDEIQGPRKRPKILPARGIDKNSKKFRRQLQSVAVDGQDILAAAMHASQKSLARLEAKDAAAKEKAKREEDRIAELKRIRGERWLPSMAREMQLNRSSGK
ncbi:uncharacterized protein LOC111291928 isoform X1 [Durio zibethinus]|uniref:Uncharacterized protein LOC111291928 isoform X1 n=1 Tax=Durio zibethinus TaxID=66656 RepID=A0A6P5YGX0_DURZI|nr:uncharacterized protein LOC111291928 isoform X1 [Durio zibethinus]